MISGMFGENYDYSLTPSASCGTTTTARRYPVTPKWDDWWNTQEDVLKGITDAINQKEDT